MSVRRRLLAGGALQFGPDGKLYFAVGENHTSGNAQSTSTLTGKVHRINPDGTIPADNPFFSTAGGQNRAFRRFCEAAIVRERIEIFGDGRQTRDFTFVADIVAATRAAAEADGVAGEVFNIGGGSRVSLNSTLERLSAIAGRPLDVDRTAREDGDVLRTGADIARAREKLGYEPSTALEDGLRAEFEWALSARPAAIPSAAARS